MEFTEEILCWVKADNARTMLTLGWIIGKNCQIISKKSNSVPCFDFNGRRFPPFMLFATSFFFVRR